MTKSDIYLLFQRILIVAALLAGTVTANARTEAGERVPAFPGAEGHGRFTAGGRGGRVVHVTNLNDDGPGSLREAVKGDELKTVVFDVSGYIDLESDLLIGSNTTLAGQSAPEGGVTVRYYTVWPAGDNIVIRFMRFRRSQVRNVNGGADAICARLRKGMILDHCSFSWSIDEVDSFYENRDFTMQWCTVAEALCDAGHGKGEHSYGGIWGGKNASFHHNLIAHCQNRTPRFDGARHAWDGYDHTKYANSVDAERVDLRNCVIYNWGTGSGCYGGPGGGYVNIVNNYYKAGPATRGKTTVTRVSIASPGNAVKSHPELFGLASRYYVDGNYVAAASRPEYFDWKGVKFNGPLTVFDGEHFIRDDAHMFGPDAGYITRDGADYLPVKLTEPVDPGMVTTHSAKDAFEKVLKYGGVSLWRDGADARYMEEALNGTVTYTPREPAGILDKINDPEGPQDPSTASFPELPSKTRPAGWDSDGDGIPDAWEKAHGLNPADPADGPAYTLDRRGWYTNVECYLNSLVEPIMKAGNRSALSPVEEYYPELIPSFTVNAK